MARLLPALFLAILAPLAAAQSDVDVRPFETLTLSAGGAATLAGAPYTEFWSPGPGVDARAAMPFYVGRVAVGATVAPHEAVGEAQPDYLALYFYGVWGADVALPAGLRLAPGVQAGLFRMQFDTDDVVAVRNESELAAGPEVWLSADVGGWQIAAGAGFTRVFTSRRIDVGFVRLSVGRTLRTPGWLRDALASDGR